MRLRFAKKSQVEYPNGLFNLWLLIFSIGDVLVARIAGINIPDPLLRFMVSV